MTRPAPAHSAALAAGDAGLSAWPPRQDGSKAPDAGTWTQWQTRRATREELATVYPRHSGLGIFCGALTDDPDPTIAALPGVEAMDFDCRQTYAAVLETAEAVGLASLIKRIESGYCDDTPHGGVRWLYRCPVGDGSLKLAQRPATAEELARHPNGKIIGLVETRGKGGYAIVAPSNGTVHPTGKAYTRRSGLFSTIVTITPEERAALFGLIRTFDQMPARDTQPLRAPPVSGNGPRPGDDYNARTTWPEVLEPHGWTHAYTRRDGVTLWRRPGKQGPAISATTNHAGSDLLCVFSTSTPFETIDARSYDRFAAYAVLNHGGDFTAAARELSARGYGQPRANLASGPRSGPGTNSVIASCPRPGSAAAATTRTLSLTPASAIRVRPVRWLWQDRVALGTFGLIAGREGVGKTTCSYTIAADVTRGTLPGAYFETPRAVVIAATEDSWEHTIVPRLMAANADLDLVYRVDVVTSEGVETAISLPRDLPALELLIREHDVALVILDPLLSRLDSALDTHKDAEVRLALEPLVSLAGATGACVLGLIHCNKSSSSDALTLVMASRAFVAVARAVLFVMVDPEDEARRLLGQPKNNLGRSDLSSLMFTIEGAHVATTDEGEVWTGRLVWAGQTDRTIRDAVEAAAESTGDRTATSEAADWLHDYLTSQGGCRESVVVEAAGKAAGHSHTALAGARKRLRLAVDARGFPRRTYWRLPSIIASAPVVLPPGETHMTGTTGTTAANRGVPVVPAVPVVPVVPDPPRAREEDAYARL